ncbi:hypothetical protein SAMN05444169_6882 [Bradyrhizobium erythrophlei]|uniref:Uncharacterized protein n=1 Tax=Bradyrhizobium erythrophlei TaxID=1437360 RepID=A0A1M5S2D2_9BRAD|nr:hypothetical protein SAMN05444169_6882 [Bradyrhizobium erythrophlei]
MKLINEEGNRYGKLLVLGYAGAKHSGRASRASWHCRCDCGRELVVSGGHLRERLMQSCGCATRFKVIRPLAAKTRPAQGPASAGKRER